MMMHGQVMQIPLSINNLQEVMQVKYKGNSNSQIVWLLKDFLHLLANNASDYSTLAV